MRSLQRRASWQAPVSATLTLLKTEEPFLPMASGPDRQRVPALFRPTRWRQLAAHLGLSVRQRQIARLMCRGCTNDDIARALRITADTVRMHGHALFTKLDVHSRVGLVVRLVVTERTLPSEDP